MYLVLVAFVKQYIGGQLSPPEFENFITTHMQDILDSNDQDAIQLAETIDALFIERQERIITDEELCRRLISLIHESVAVTGASNIISVHSSSYSPIQHMPSQQVTWGLRSALANR